MKKISALFFLLIPFTLAASTSIAPAQFTGFIGYLSASLQDVDQGQNIALYSETTVTFIYGEDRIKGLPPAIGGARPPKSYTYQVLDDTHALLVVEGQGPRTLTFTSPSRATSHGNRESVEYLLHAPSDEMLNTSARVPLGPGKSAIVGFVLEGTRSRWVLVRAVGPGLKAYGVTDALADPRLTLRSAAKVIETIGSWRTSGVPQSAFTEVTNLVGAFPLAVSSDDALLFYRLEPGIYSATCASVSGTGTGDVLTEVYVLP